MNLSGWKSASSASSSRSSRASSASRPMSPVSIPAHLTASSGRSNAFAIAASTRPSRSPIRSSPAEHLDDALGGERVATGRGGRAGVAPWRPGPDAASIAANVAATSGSVGRRLGRRCVARPAQDVLDGAAEVGRAVVGLAEVGSRIDAGDSATAVAIADQPRPVARWSASGNGRPVRKTAAIGSSSARQAAQVVGEEGGLLGGPGRGRDALGELAPATHGGDGIPFRRWPPRTWFPEVAGRVPDRPAPARPGEPRGVPALVRRPEVARLARYQDGADARRRDRAVLRRPGVGPDALAMAIHERATTAWSGPARSASSTATTARRCTTSRSARRTPGAAATAPRRPG